MVKYCAICGAECEEIDVFCSRCGAKIGDFPAPEEKDEIICGKSKKQLKTFIGPNNKTIISRFHGMELANSKISICWPPLILSVFLGFFGLAIWFFYRKMYKPAAIFTVIAVVSLTWQVFFIYQALGKIMPFGLTAYNMELLIDAVSNGTYLLPGSIDYATIISDLSQFAAVCIGGLYGMFFYKRHVFANIDKILEEYEPEEVERQLKRRGGVSALSVVLSVLIMFFISIFIHIGLAIIVF